MIQVKRIADCTVRLQRLIQSALMIGSIEHPELKRPPTDLRHCRAILRSPYGRYPQNNKI